MTPLFPQKPTRLRARRRKIRLVVFGICLLTATGLVGGAGFASHMEQLAIKDISVSGAQELPADALVAAVNTSLDHNLFKIFSGRNIFLYQGNTIAESLAAAFPRIKNVGLSRPALLAQAVVVSVEERAPFAKWCSQSTCFLLDNEGFIFAELKNETPAVPYIFHGGLISGEPEVGQFFLQGRFRDVVHFLGVLKEAGYPAREFRVENEKDFSVTVEQGFALRVPFDAGLDGVVRNLVLALEADSVRGRESEIEYIDLRFGNRIYYKFR